MSFGQPFLWEHQSIICRPPITLSTSTSLPSFAPLAFPPLRSAMIPPSSAGPQSISQDASPPSTKQISSSLIPTPKNARSKSTNCLQALTTPTTSPASGLLFFATNAPQPTMRGAALPFTHGSGIPSITTCPTTHLSANSLRHRGRLAITHRSSGIALSRTARNSYRMLPKFFSASACSAPNAITTLTRNGVRTIITGLRPSSPRSAVSPAPNQERKSSLTKLE